MSANTTIRVTGTHDGLVRVWVPDTTRESRQAARKLAAAEAHTIVGAAQDLGTAKGGHVLAFAPVTRSAAKAEAPSLADTLAGLGLTPDQVARVVAAYGPGGPKSAKAAKAPREVPDFIKRAQAVTCRTCRDHGVVRGVGQRAGQPYRTADGAAAAKAAGRAVKCPSHKRAAKAA